ncbi:hypothetical protein SKAU_G00110030 [Synaphobranchus kaupii]|uniref:Uncharacterized protein n=1 Tax=Synaphobranchus kaupii TaxID=118154 RepID=A0A9Q1G121_SYNKA|nr:hypothetical protein SKAU_G00110030 [Synaphobranchus kaupii]
MLPEGGAHTLRFRDMRVCEAARPPSQHRRLQALGNGPFQRVGQSGPVDGRNPQIRMRIFAVSSDLRSWENSASDPSRSSSPNTELHSDPRLWLHQWHQNDELQMVASEQFPV